MGGGGGCLWFCVQSSYCFCASTRCSVYSFLLLLLIMPIKVKHCFSLSGLGTVAFRLERSLSSSSVLLFFLLQSRFITVWRGNVYRDCFYV